MTKVKGHKLVVVRDHRQRTRATCKCGWRSLNCDSTLLGLNQSFGAHVYAMGLRTKAEIEASQKAAA